MAKPISAWVQARPTLGGSPLVRISAPHFCAGIIRGGACAPILRWMKGMTLREIKACCAQRGWSVEVIEHD